jgi:hypothetical protein
MIKLSIKQAVAPLRMIFWGGLLCVFDITFSQTTNGQGFKFDILNDALGMGLITCGVFSLASAPVHRRYASVMTFVLIVSVLALLDAIRDHFILPLPPAIHLLQSLFGIACLAAIIAFCVAMRWCCEEAQLPRAAASWSVTTILFVAIYLLPLGLLYLAGVFAMLTSSSFNFNLGPAGLLVLPVFAIPLIHLFVSTSRMSRDSIAYLRSQPSGTIEG